MAKKAEQNKVCDKTGLTLEQNTVYDDNLLPSADELAKLDAVSKDIIPWIMKRTEMEQDARIKFNEDRMKIAQDDFKHVHRYNFTALIMAFIIAVAFLAASFLSDTAWARDYRYDICRRNCGSDCFIFFEGQKQRGKIIKNRNVFIPPAVLLAGRLT